MRQLKAANSTYLSSLIFALCGVLVAPFGSVARADSSGITDCGLEPPGSPPWPEAPKRPHEWSVSKADTSLPHVRPVDGASVARGAGAPLGAPLGALASQTPWGRKGGGFLTGKTVYLSPGHGFTSISFGWRTQRGNTNGIVEDLVSAEAVQLYLGRYLRQAGARVVTVREPDLTTSMVIVDDSDASAYVEQGRNERFVRSTQPGFAHYVPPISGPMNPFEQGENRLLLTAKTADARAVYTPTFPESTEYNVYVSYSQHASRASDAHYIVRHPGGEAHFRLDQRRHGGTWILLGRFYFPKGKDPSLGSVVIENDSATPGSYVSADAVRFGGGMGDTDRGKGISMRPRFEECSRYFAQWNGAPQAVYDNPALEDRDDDVGTRSRFAAWDHEDGEDAVYLAWHTNAPNPAVGTSSYVYGPNPPDGSYDFTGVPGSDVMMRLVHDEIVGDIRKGWDPNWRDRGKFTAYFGEVNPRNNPEMPSALIEVAFHDTPADAAQLKEPNFRRLVARAMYQGLARFFAQKDGKKVALLPEPPRAVAVKGISESEVELNWQPPEAGPQGLLGDAPTAYRIYQSKDGLSFDEGTEVMGQRAVLMGLRPGEVRYLRITSVNEGGESFPSSLLPVRTRKGGLRARVLLVGGFERLDGSMLVQHNLAKYDIGTVGRMLLDQMNDGSYLSRHARAFAAADVSFDSCERSALSMGDGVKLMDYALVDWQAGETSQSPKVLTDKERELLSTYRQGAGRLVLSGSEIFYALSDKGTEGERAFVRGLSVSYLGDDSKIRMLAPVASRIFDGLGEIALDDGTKGVYNVHTPDVLGALPPGRVEMVYKGGEGASAVLDNPERPTAISFGFPLETIYDEGQRVAVFGRLLLAMGIPADPLPMEMRPDPPAPDLGMGGEMPGCGCHVGRGTTEGGSLPLGLPLVALAFGVVVSLRRRR